MHARDPPHAAWALAACASLLVMTAVPTHASALGNSVDARVNADNSAVAACQLIVLVNAVILLDWEDSLALATLPAVEPARLHFAQSQQASGTLAECSILVRKIRVVFDDLHASVPAGATSYVSGAPLVSERASAGAARNAWNVEVTGEGSAAAVCQKIVLVNSVVVGGGAYGIPVGAGSNVLHASAAPAIRETGARAACDVTVESVEASGRSG